MKKSMIVAAAAMLAVGGLLEPFGHHCLNDESAEKIIFGMNEGEVTPVMRVEMPEATSDGSGWASLPQSFTLNICNPASAACSPLVWTT